MNRGKQKLKLKWEPYELLLKDEFTLSGSSRSTTPIILTKIEFEGFTGYGEASMPPYLGESLESASWFLSRVNMDQFHDPFQTEDILNYVDQISPDNNAAKASVDIALHDLIGKLNGKPCYEMWKINPQKTPDTSFTIGIDKPDKVRKKVEQAKDFKILKIKLGSENDKEIIEAVRSATQLPLLVDANQAWIDKHKALEMIHWLNEHGVILIEQPMPAAMRDEMAWLTEHSPIPTLADESVKRLEDIDQVKQVFSGVNIKLMKSTGLLEARKMIEKARSLNLKIMIGCMTETSCGVSAAAQLSPLADWADLDGNLLISNDVFRGVSIFNGKVQLNNLPGIGIIPLKNHF